MKFIRYAQVLPAASILFVFSCFNMICMQQAPRWKGRAVLMAIHPKTQELNVLLAHARGADVRSDWSDFSAESRSSEKGNAVASRAIREQTNGQYEIDLTRTPHYYKQSPAGDWFHFVSVPFKAGSVLYDSGKNSEKDDFVWVPASSIINRQPIMHPRRGQIMISQGVYAFLRQNLTAAINYFNQRGGTQIPPAHAVPAPAPVVVPQAAPAAAGAPWGPHKPNHIYFYDRNKPYYEFTNFYSAPVNMPDGAWRTSEHYFQAQKYPNNPALQERIRGAATPRQAFDITRDPANDRFKDPNWDTNKLQVMLNGVRAKFTQNPALRTALVNTGTAVLVEDAGANDPFWGAGADYRGGNHLGRILMHVRDEFAGKIPAGTQYQP